MTTIESPYSNTTSTTVAAEIAAELSVVPNGPESLLIAAPWGTFAATAAKVGAVGRQFQPAEDPDSAPKGSWQEQAAACPIASPDDTLTVSRANADIVAGGLKLFAAIYNRAKEQHVGEKGNIVRRRALGAAILANGIQNYFASTPPVEQPNQ